MIEGWIAIYGYGDEIRVQPTLYGSKEEAVLGLEATLGNYRSAHLRFVCKPVYVKVEDGLAEG